jgi:hypothetical protein
VPDRERLAAARLSLPRRVTIRASGHPEIRGTHHKSIEVTRDREITGRATCVVGVSAGKFPAELHLLRGPVRITIAASGARPDDRAAPPDDHPVDHPVDRPGERPVDPAGGGRLVGQAVINPGHEVERRLVVRRSGRSDPDTLANHADFAADDLDSTLRTALERAGAPVAVTVAEIGPPAPLVLVGTPAADLPGRPGRLWRHADATVPLDGAFDPASARKVVAAGGVVAATLAVPLDRAPPRAISFLLAAAEQGARLLAPAADDASVALLAAGLTPAPALRLGAIDRKAARSPAVAAMLRLAPLPAVLTVSPADAEQILGPLAAGPTPAGGRRIAVASAEIDVGVKLQWTSVTAALPRLAGSGGPVTVVLAAREQATPIDVSDVAHALLDAGVPARTLADALRPWGLTRSEVYRWHHRP